MYQIDVYGLSTRHEIEREVLRNKLTEYFYLSVGVYKGKSEIVFYDNPNLLDPENSVVLVHITTRYYHCYGEVAMTRICNEVLEIVRTRVFMDTVCIALPEMIDYARSRLY